MVIINKILKLFGPDYVRLSDEELMGLIIQNDSHAFEILYHRYKNTVYRYLNLKLGKSYAEDELQEVFIKLFKFKNTFSHQSKFKTWFWAIIKNSVIDKYRSAEFNQSKKNTELNEEVEIDESEIDEKLIQKASVDEINKIIKEFSELNIEIFNLHVYAEMTFIEISTVLKMKESTVKTIYFRMKKQINIQLARNQK